MSEIVNLGEMFSERLDEIETDLQSTSEELINLKTELARVAGQLSKIVEQMSTLT